MKNTLFDLTVSRKGFTIPWYRFDLKNHFVSITFIVFTLMACNEAKLQTQKELKEVRKKESDNNFEQFYLGATRMCMDTNYNQFFGDYREVTYSPRDGNCCTEIVPSPYIDPYEFYLAVLGEDEGIYSNNGDPFEVQRIREKIHGRKDDTRKKALEIDVNNLVYFTQCFFVKYDMAKEEIKLTVPTNLAFGHSNSKLSVLVSSLGVNTNELPSEITLPLNTDRAEAFFDHYKENSPIGKLVAYAQINARVTYSLQFPKSNGKYSKFDAVVKKIEFYPKDNWTDKIVETTF